MQKENQKNSELLTIKEVEKILKLSPSTIRRMVNQGELNGYPVRKGIRIEKQSIEQYLKLCSIQNKININKQIVGVWMRH